MRYGIEIINFGVFANPRAVVEIAQLAEESGWEGLWLWDHRLKQRNRQNTSGTGRKCQLFERA